MSAAAEFLAARDRLLALREDYTSARQVFRWPRPREFNWALDVFDRVPQPERTALWIAREGGDERRSFTELSRRSDQVASWLRGLGIRRGDRPIAERGAQHGFDGFADVKRDGFSIGTVGCRGRCAVQKEGTESQQEQQSNGIPKIDPHHTPQIPPVQTAREPSPPIGPMVRI